METFLLNPNVAAQNPVSQQGVATADSNGEGDFSPLLNEAVNSLENEETAQGNAEQPDTPLSDNENELINENDLAISADDTIAQIFMSTTEAPPTKPLETAVLAKTDATLTKPIEATVLATTEGPLSGQLALSAEMKSELPKEALQPQGITPGQIQPEKAAALLPQESPAPVTPQGSNSALASTSKVENLLLQQIQQILDQGKNSGSIIVTGNNSPTPDEQSQTNPLHNLSNPLLVEADTKKGAIQARQVGITVTPTDDKTIASQKSAKLEGAHQDISEQYLNAKLGESKNSTSENSQQNNNQKKGTEQKFVADTKTSANGTPGTPGTTVTDTKPGDSSFGQQLGHSATTSSSLTSSPTTSIEGKMAPGAEIPVSEKEMLNTLIQRFNVNPRLQTSKLTMQLHPAELGALKIDLLVKGDSIKANIVAQSQQVLETLEKHLPRLRTVLQDQGFTIDSFEISLDGDGGNQKELFQEHFNSQQQEFAFNKSSSQQAESFDVLLESTEDSDETDNNDSGINLTV